MARAKPALDVLRRLRPRDFALFLDVDGTLLDIAPHPDAVEVPSGLVADLASGERALGGALALVSGRPVGDLDRLFAPLRLCAAGVHGAELRRTPEAAVDFLAPGRLGEAAWDALLRLIGEFPGSYAENKSASFAVHYPDPGTDAEQLHAALARFAEANSAPGRRLGIIAGHAVFEVKLEGFDKGRAIRMLSEAAPFHGRKPVFIGDDEIDRPGFDAALALGGWGFSVAIELAGLSGVFSGPDAVRGWLHEIAR